MPSIVNQAFKAAALKVRRALRRSRFNKGPVINGMPEPETTIYENSSSGHIDLLQSATPWLTSAQLLCAVSSICTASSVETTVTLVLSTADAVLAITTNLAVTLDRTTTQEHQPGTQRLRVSIHLNDEIEVKVEVICERI